MKMNIHASAMAVLLAALSLPVQAGDFRSLQFGTGPGPDGIWGNANDTNAVGKGPDGVAGTADDTTALVSGGNNIDGDKLYLKTLSITPRAGNAFVPSSITYAPTEWRAPAQGGTVPRGTAGTGSTLTLLDFHVTTGITLGSQTIGDAYDFVFRDSRDQKLVFGSRFVLGQSPGYRQDAELNFMYRYGFKEGDKVFSTDVAWTFYGNSDLRLYNASRSDKRSLTGVATLDLNAVSFQADVNPSEGNAFSGLYLVKTDATAYKTLANALGYYQAGEEGQPLLYRSISGFAPTVPIPVVVPSPVPEPSGYALLLAGLGLTGVMARRARRI